MKNSAKIANQRMRKRELNALSHLGCGCMPMNLDCETEEERRRINEQWERLSTSTNSGQRYTVPNTEREKV